MHAEIRSECSLIPCGLSSIVRQQLSILLSYSDQELVNRHRRVNSNFATKKGLDFVFLYDIVEKLDVKTDDFGQYGSLSKDVANMSYLDCLGRMLS